MRYIREQNLKKTLFFRILLFIDLNIIVYDLTEDTVTDETLYTFHVYWFHLNAHVTQVKLITGTCC